ncbi:hypothetical protein RO03_09280 [Fusobacterium nucleatum subsp. nucleatum]|uniref:Uncharacterized protein n=3 Tax=Fusobacterium nucleatum subsp. nucleatum TaxID=76856 RepID=Q8RI34_FUSNN|nr:unknown [Fusobacterium nucleatum subsp. nucleatum ATCC 25586]EFG94680.1 hypothetical protein HMPREF0397_1676 [Fusobacterium nucleatum subsp. nucleatum ATCC 23726]KUL99675.1 hypothetical protein RO03_09280 [Fusobacterium nucleatum subsp. nucleatum]
MLKKILVINNINNFYIEKFHKFFFRSYLFLYIPIKNLFISHLNINIYYIYNF